MGLKIYSRLPDYIKDISRDNKEFKLLSKNVLCYNSFCTLDEYSNTIIYKSGFDPIIYI